jgi:hypothetical protein
MNKKQNKNIVKPRPQRDKYEKSGIYEMRCMDYTLKYIQTRHKEHIQAIRNKNSNSGYSNNILNKGHAYGNITDTMKVIKIVKKGKHLNTSDKYHIYKISKAGLHTTDTLHRCL